MDKQPVTYRLHDRLNIAILAGLLLFAPLARGGAPGWSAAAIGLVVLTGVALCLARATWEWSLLRPRTVIDLPILFLAGLLLASAAFSRDSGLSLPALGKFAAYIAVFYLTVIALRDFRASRLLPVWIIGVSSFLALFALLKGAGLNPFAWWDYPDLNYPDSFLAGTFGNHNHLAGWLEMAIPLLLVTFFGRNRAKWFFPRLFLLGLLVAVLVLSQSRGGWLGFLAGIIFLMGTLLIRQRGRKRRLSLILAGVGLLCGIVIVSSPATSERLMSAEAGIEESSLSDRILVWGGVRRMIEEQPLLGAGPGTFKTIYPNYQPPGLSHRYYRAHNDYLEFTAELGLGFPLLLVWLTVLLYRQGFGKLRIRSESNEGLLVLAALTGITSILVHSLVDFNLQLPANALLFTVLAALVVGGEDDGGRQASKLAS